MKLGGFISRHSQLISELWRYYKIGVINTIFGYALFSILIFFSVGLFVAQILSHVAGMIFNYFTYSKHVFSDHSIRRVNFFGAYVLNYFIGLAFLAGFHTVIASPYGAGLAAVIATSLLNYLILKRFVYFSK